MRNRSRGTKKRVRAKEIVVVVFLDVPVVMVTVQLIVKER